MASWVQLEAVPVPCWTIPTRWTKLKPKAGSGISTGVSCILSLENCLTAELSCGDDPERSNRTLIILRQLDLSLSTLHLSKDRQKCIGATEPPPPLPIFPTCCLSDTPRLVNVDTAS